MEKKQGRVRNIVVSNVEVVSDVVERMLCKNGVSYVHVDNEFHCFDKIIRFYSFEEYNEYRELLNFALEGSDRVGVIDPMNMAFARGPEEIKKTLFLEESNGDEITFGDEEKSYSYTKAINKHNNKEVNDKLRQNGQRAERIINRKRCDL